MKTKIKHLLGAALCLLATSTTAHAAGNGKAGGGGGGGSSPGGTIYYSGNFPGWGSGILTISMSPDGSKQTAIGSGEEPTLNLYNGHRWFFSKEVFTDQLYPDGSHRGQYLALRDDYPTPYTAETRAHLIDDVADDPTLQLYGAHWLLDDGWASFVGRRWSSTEADAVVVEGGIYTAPVAFDAAGNIAGLVELPTSPTIPMPLEPTVEYLWPEVGYYSWNPEGTQIVYTKRSVSGVWVADLLGSDTLISSDRGYDPQWSPDELTIVYEVSGGLVTIKPDGKRRSWIVWPESDWLFRYAHWSPDSLYLVFSGWPKVDDGVYSAWADLFLVKANGRDMKNITNTPEYENTLPFRAGWR